MAGVANLTCEQGATFDRSLTYKDENGTAVNLTTYNARMDIRFAATKEADLVLRLTNANGRATISNPSGGVIRLLISSTDTEALVAGVYFYDLELFTIDSTNPPLVVRLIRGKFTVDAEITG